MRAVALPLSVAIGAAVGLLAGNIAIGLSLGLASGGALLAVLSAKAHGTKADEDK